MLPFSVDFKMPWVMWGYPQSWLQLSSVCYWLQISSPDSFPECAARSYHLKAIRTMNPACSESTHYHGFYRHLFLPISSQACCMCSSLYLQHLYPPLCWSSLVYGQTLSSTATFSKMPFPSSSPLLHFLLLSLVPTLWQAAAGLELSDHMFVQAALYSHSIPCS
jgi:hypothetical protein